MSQAGDTQASDAPNSSYQAVESASCAFDECFSSPGEIRPHWQTLISSWDRLGHDEQGVRGENSRRILAEHGVTCFVNRRGGGTDEPWQLDLLPLVFGGEEWRALEAGLLQRARLLNLVLGDLYGTQRLVRDGFVPAPLVFANPGYLRACQAIDVEGGAYLQIYAADLARSTDGQWWVLADRTQAPGGLGFALENRSILSRVLPEAIRAVQPRPISDALRIRRDTLRRFAPQHADNPSIVLLTPGPRNEAYFEHAYLSRLLGLTLVEGDDLTVRDRRLFIKTLDGLRRADVVLRRVSDAFCDPLELRADSLLGVPGLVEAARAGHVSVGNALGTGLLESPAFLPFLPGLCRHLLDEELRLPSLATWWCGQAHEQNYVREHLDELVVRPALSLMGTPAKPIELSAGQRAYLLEQLRLRPHEFVAQEQVRLSHAPVWTHTQRDSRPFVLRVFVLHDGNDFIVTAGGLARMVEDDRLGSFALPLSGVSKDVWVLPDGQSTGAPAQVVTAPQPALERAASDLPSRTADNFYWLGRYAERLEQIVRMSRYVLRCLADDSGMASQGRIAPLEEVLARLRLVSKSASADRSRESLQKEVLLLLFQADRASGVRDLLKRIHLTAFSVRDRLSADTWRILTRLEPDARQRPSRLPLVQASATLHTLVHDLAAFSGMEMENMTRGHGWAFLDLGRRLERGTFIAKLMEGVLSSGPHLDLLLEPALEIVDSVMTHRRRYFTEPRLSSVMEVLVRDAGNPRSLAFQIASLEKHGAALPTGANPDGVTVVQFRIGQLAAELRQLQAGARGDAALAVEVSGQADLLTRLAADLGELSELLTQVYFSHVTPQVN
jgi:uncharacterized circularly permuted ATP-grasp superfamily protein/uncharacterized alpha-E superfamily protein